MATRLVWARLFAQLSRAGRLIPANDLAVAVRKDHALPRGVPSQAVRLARGA